MATIFHRFPYLPWELRARIWELSAEPRTVQVLTGEYGKPLSDASVGKKEYKRVFSSTPMPAMLQVCRESRNLGVYRQCFSEVERIPDFVPKASWRRYVWLNLDLDIIDIGMQDLRDLKLVAPSIKRLKLERAGLTKSVPTSEPGAPRAA
ncbi:hypothetical protein B0H65DRAFT_512281 [Neurospora tetraspora]|uniref:2EXR domain-containing protein n=1 Tax=Neurospora tetraspora TaxID=94610 RepID=A0AAE0J7R3_9PEZI|nr:hypothetical protein B0H65DRAFT_512281 [Neurospora tetraspora]